MGKSENNGNAHRLRQVLLWIIVVALSCLIIMFGHKTTSKGLKIFNDKGNASYRATVVSVADEEKESRSLGVNMKYVDKNIHFKCKIEGGSDAGKKVNAIQTISGMYVGSSKVKAVEKGDSVLVSQADLKGYSNSSGGVTGDSAASGTTGTTADSSASGSVDSSTSGDSVKVDSGAASTASGTTSPDSGAAAGAGSGLGSGWYFVDYYRLDKIMYLALVFAILLVVIGRVKGINTLVSLAFTTMFVFSVFLPWVLNGKNIYLGVLATCGFTIIMSLMILEGATKKSLVTILGCSLGTGIAALISYIMNIFLHLTGVMDEHSMFLILFSPKHHIDLLGIIFAAIVIGALGAIMDVAMDISSSLYELVRHVPDITFKKLFRSGMQIGRDIMGTMANTLVLAYIGSGLCGILLLFTYSSSLLELLNREVVIVELLQAFTGSLAILLTAPFTVAIAGLIYLNFRGKGDDGYDDTYSGGSGRTDENAPVKSAGLQTASAVPSVAPAPQPAPQAPSVPQSVPAPQSAPIPQSAPAEETVEGKRYNPGKRLHTSGHERYDAKH